MSNSVLIIKMIKFILILFLAGCSFKSSNNSNDYYELQKQLFEKNKSLCLRDCLMRFNLCNKQSTDNNSYGYDSAVYICNKSKTFCHNDCNYLINNE